MLKVWLLASVASDGPGIATGIVDPSDRLNLPVTPLRHDYNFRTGSGQANSPFDRVKTSRLSG